MVLVMMRLAALCALALFACTAGALADPLERTSGARDSESINVTIYNGGMALVHDRRHVRLTQGLNRIAWRDVSAQMDATSALVHAIDPADRVNVLEQNFDYDLLNPSALLNKYVGKYVTVVHEARFPGERDTRERAKVLSVNGGVVLQYRDRIETQVRGHIVFPRSSRNFRDKPTLVLDLQSVSAGTHLLDLGYLTNGLTWSADYVGLMSPDETHLNLTGLITLSNSSGIDYDNARLQLMAGNVNAPPSGSEEGVPMGTTSDTYSSANNVSQENYFEYHLYTLGRPTTILNDQTKQVVLLTAHNVPIRKTLELRGSAYYYRIATPDLGTRLPVGVYVSFANRGGDLGVPLPAGTVRLYKADSKGLSQFAGADTIDHTPRNETVRLHLGDSFDVTANKKQTDFQFEGGCNYESAYEIRLGNAKRVPQTVEVVEPIPGQWTILDENLPHQKSSAFTATWSVRVPADSHVTLRYHALVSWC
jgi:hypothetical protein